MKAATLKRSIVLLFAAVGLFLAAMVFLHPVGPPWMWAVLFVVYIPALLIVVSVTLYLTRLFLRSRR